MEEPISGTHDSTWRMRLDCGHVVSVPWGTQPPFVLACLVQHQHLCERSPGAVSGPLSGFPTQAAPPFASYR
jgi:hypothetical protein